ncbi:MAG: hypothetical protein ACFB03_01280 [Paracoccaceae bacterium]
MKDQDDTQVFHVFTDIPDAPTLEHKPRILRVDVEKFQHRLDNCELSDAEKAEYLQIIWSIVLEFIDLGYGVHPVQHFCGKDQGDAVAAASNFQNLVGSKNQKTSNEEPSVADLGTGEQEDS